jgi:cytochrome c oxidase subunit II
MGAAPHMMNYLPLDNISSFGPDIDGVIGLVFWVTGIWLVVAELVLIGLVIRYRKKDGKRAIWLPGEKWRTTAWVIIPVILVALCDFAIETSSARVWDMVKVDVPKHDVLVRITARQFAWSFTYAGEDGVLDTGDDFSNVGELHIPRDKVVRFQLESLDVLHSFFVPAMRLKQDVVPGRSIPGWFDANKEGRYEIACAELCGSAHTQMRAVLVVDSPENFASWTRTVAAQRALATPEVQ